MISRALLLVLSASLPLAGGKPMAFLDVMRMRTPADGVLSKDASAFAYTISTLDWKQGKRFTDIWVTDTASGRSRQFTFTAGKNESNPAFSPDGRTIAFLLDRESGGTAAVKQVYAMPVDGGEARKLAEIAGGATAVACGGDGTWVAILGGRDENRQIWLAPTQGGAARPLTRHGTGVLSFAWSDDASAIYFTAPDETSAIEKKRMELKFDVRVVDQPKPPSHLWRVAPSDGSESRLTSGSGFTVREFSAAKTGGWIGVLSDSTGRHDGDIATRKREAWLLHAPTGKLDRLTDNAVSETLPRVSPDGRAVAMIAPDGFTYFGRSRIYVRSTAGGEWRKLPGDDWDHDPQGIDWSADSKSIRFESGVGAETHGYAVDASTGALTQLTRGALVLDLTAHDETGQYLILAEDPRHPKDYFLASKASLDRPESWRRLSSANPGIGEFELATTETVRWKSTDGATIEGLLVKPAGYDPAKRYPLVVQIHGGPAAASVQSFAGSYSRYDHVWVAAGYVMLHPNYRGSTNYGEKFKTSIVGNYFPQAFGDIMTGVDHLIARGIADPDKMGFMGWSAGGHWSNWTLTHTNRFKAISSGAGAMNWISMYAQNDSQANRENYFKGAPYDNFEHWWDMSPLKYIKNARTPALIHVGHDDPRVPRPQSEELHMALKKMGVPTEFIVYPRMGHGLTEPRYQMVKMVSEFRWIDKWIHGREKWFDWQEITGGVPTGADSDK